MWIKYNLCSVTFIKEESFFLKKNILQRMCNLAKLIQSWETHQLNFVPASAMADPTFLY